MQPWRREDGVWMVPRSIRDKKRGVVGSGFRPLLETDPDYEQWTEWIRENIPEPWAVVASGQ